MLDEHLWFEIGSGDFLHCFFSTISYRLEPNGWGSKYPFMMKKLYHEDMEKKYNLQLLEEVKAIQNSWSISPDDVVWDIEDLSKQPPWGEINDPSIMSLANYFSTESGPDLLICFMLR
nr:Imm70 family immunity protein [Cohnella hashimotonis]